MMNRLAIKYFDNYELSNYIFSLFERSTSFTVSNRYSAREITYHNHRGVHRNVLRDVISLTPFFLLLAQMTGVQR